MAKANSGLVLSIADVLDTDAIHKAEKHSSTFHLYEANAFSPSASLTPLNMNSATMEVPSSSSAACAPRDQGSTHSADNEEEVELRCLESKLQLLTIQRQLSALKCEAFLAELDCLQSKYSRASPQRSPHQHTALSSQGAAAPSPCHHFHGSQSLAHLHKVNRLSPAYQLTKLSPCTQPASLSPAHRHASQALPGGLFSSQRRSSMDSRRSPRQVQPGKLHHASAAQRMSQRRHSSPREDLQRANLVDSSLMWDVGYAEYYGANQRTPFSRSKSCRR